MRICRVAAYGRARSRRMRARCDKKNKKKNKTQL
jgi:hypothetical protein